MRQDWQEEVHISTMLFNWPVKARLLVNLDQIYTKFLW